MNKFHYRDHLVRLLEERCQKNSRYSLRAFARDLNLSASRLSGVLSGKFGLSRDAAEKLGETLGMSVGEKKRFCDSVESEHARSPLVRKAARQRLVDDFTSFKKLPADQFNVVSDWYHFALMELTRTAEFSKKDLPTIAKRLGISVYEAQGAVRRLLDLGLLREENGGRLALTGSFLANSEGTPSEAIRKHHVQILKKAEVAISNQTIHERTIRTLTLAIHPDQKKEIQLMMDAFQKELQNKLNADARPKTEVYGFAMQGFRLTEKSND